MVLSVLRRMLGSVPTLFALATITFFVIRFAPGGPFDGEKKLPPALIARMEAQFHLNEPLWQQYLRFLGDVVRLDFGQSMYYREYTVTQLIGHGLPISLQIGLWATLLYAVAGVTLGVVAALRRNGPLDNLVSAVAMGGIVVPTFVMAPILQIVFALMLSLLPVAGWDNGWRSMVLPVVAMALPNIAYVARLTRGAMIETLRSNYIRTARAKGVGEWRVLTHHAIRGAMIPVIAYLGPATAGLITGSMVIETIFAVPGIGRYFVESAISRDYTMVMGVTLVYGTCIILFNMVTDVAQMLLDPRSRT